MNVPVLRRSWELMRPHRRLVLLAALGIVGSTLVTISGPFLLKYSLDEGILKRDQSAFTLAALA